MEGNVKKSLKDECLLLKSKRNPLNMEKENV